MEPQKVELWGGWSLILPSPCQTARNQDGSWSAWDETHVVDLSIIEIGGRHGGGAIGAEEMLTGTEHWVQHQVGDVIIRTSDDIEVTDTTNGPEPIEWTRVQAGATNTALVMSIGNPGVRDETWHDLLWRSVRHAPKQGRFGRLRGC